MIEDTPEEPTTSARTQLFNTNGNPEEAAKDTPAEPAPSTSTQLPNEKQNPEEEAKDLNFNEPTEYDEMMEEMQMQPLSQSTPTKAAKAPEAGE